ncbi:transcription cofactor vestigial-like protein 2 [Lytechinus variegatus]|uniref:transcription cofactor vestigial-like protein 2 n=1 Tax=Lytechinus variegatus TaxID=7654 RepID=UPI001BB19243|nr:transcription cofactor vestigial-like protein 2 [Lytechinus variegatus]
MSCLDVMYQGTYQPYQYPFYQRPFAQKFGHYKMQEAMGLDSAVDYSSTSSHHHPTSHTPSLSAFSTTTNPHHHHFHHHPAAATATHYTGHGSVGSHGSGVSAGSVQGHSGHSSLHSTPSSLATPSSALGVKEEEESGNASDKDPAPEADYVNSRCVIFTFYSGDLDKIVDEHFSRSLSHQGSYAQDTDGKQRTINGSDLNSQNDSGDSRRENSNWPSKNNGSPTPMCKRSFPPSFWNSNFYSNVTNCNNNNANISSNSLHLNSMYPTSTSTHHDTSSLLNAAQAAADSYTMHHHAHHRAASMHHSQAEAWHYGFPAHHQSSYAHHHHAGLHELGYGVSPGSAFSPRYSSLLIQPSVRPGRLPTIPGQCDFTKSSTTEWPSTYTPHSHQSTTEVPSYTVETGSAVDSHETTNKDLYWF